jgi:hypothetical protein
MQLSPKICLITARFLWNTKRNIFQNERKSRKNPLLQKWLAAEQSRLKVCYTCCIRVKRINALRLGSK